MRHFLAALCLCTIPLTTAAAGDPKIKDATATKNLQPPGSKLNVTAKVQAPTPCHTAKGSFAGDQHSNPPAYLLKITLNNPTNQGTACPQVVSYVDLDFTEDPYAGLHDRVILQHPDNETLTVNIKEVH
jgi:hypothetical protein